MNKLWFFSFPRSRVGMHTAVCVQAEVWIPTEDRGNQRQTTASRLWFVIATVLFTGCATQTPAPISTIPASNVSVAEVRSDPARFKDSEVRWGGVITGVDNQPSHTLIEVVSQTLGSNGQPQKESISSGRFIASFTGFADPLIYSTGRLLTVVGTITGETTRPIGEYSYSFPIVTVTASYLWPVEVEAPLRPDYPPPWWYYDPWPYYPRPFPPYRHPYYW